MNDKTQQPTEEQLENQEATKDPNVQIVELDNPIERNGTKFSTVRVIKPVTGTLRGLSLQSVLQWDVDTLTELLPRITQPPLTKPEISKLEICDMTALSVAVTNFLLSAKQKSQLPSMI